MEIYSSCKQCIETAKEMKLLVKLQVKRVMHANHVHKLDIVVVCVGIAL